MPENAPPAGWQSIDRPPSLFRRFEFDSYALTRGFLDRLEKLSQETGIYPDLGFGPKHVNVTLYGPGGTPPEAGAFGFAARAGALAA